MRSCGLSEKEFLPGVQTKNRNRRKIGILWMRAVNKLQICHFEPKKN